MRHETVYKVIQTSWGVHVRLVAEAYRTDDDAAPEGCRRVAPGLSVGATQESGAGFEAVPVTATHDRAANVYRIEFGADA